MLKIRLIAVAASLSLIGAGTNMVFGQDYPNKSIRMIAPGAGGSTDFAARIVAQGISPGLGQQVIMDNRATTFLASEAAYKAPPDGYTLHVNGTSLLTIPLLQQAPYDAVRDFSPISVLVKQVFLVTVHPSVPAKSIKELIALAKARPGVLNYSSTSVGAPAHLAGELFKSMARVNIVNVPYKGSAAGNTALLSGEVQMTFVDVGGVAQFVKSGRLRALAVTSLEPSALAPGLPTVAASGLSGYEVLNITGMWAPVNTPVTIVNRLNQEVVRVLNLPDVKERFLKAGVEIVASSPDDAAKFIKAEISKWSKVIKEAGIKAE